MKVIGVAFPDQAVKPINKIVRELWPNLVDEAKGGVSSVMFKVTA